VLLRISLEILEPIDYMLHYALLGLLYSQIATEFTPESLDVIGREEFKVFRGSVSCGTPLNKERI
jgi:hypothetical protein